MQFEEGEDGVAQLKTLRNVRVIEQDMDFRFKTREGEHPTDPEFGLPFSRLIGVFDSSFVDREIASEAEDSVHISETLSVSSSLDDRTGEMFVEADVRASRFADLVLETRI